MCTMVIARTIKAIAFASDSVPTLATTVQHIIFLLSYHANNSINLNTVYRCYHGTNTYNPTHCFSFSHASDFSLQSAAPHLSTGLLAAHSKTITLYTLVTMVTRVYLHFFSAWDMVLISATRMHHHLRIPPQKLPSSAVLLLLILEYSTARFGDSTAWHNSCIKFHSYLSSNSRVETCGETDRNADVTSP
jgi:hypothetical protein